MCWATVISPIAILKRRSVHQLGQHPASDSLPSRQSESVLRTQISNQWMRSIANTIWPMCLIKPRKACTDPLSTRAVASTDPPIIRAHYLGRQQLGFQVVRLCTTRWSRSLRFLMLTIVQACAQLCHQSRSVSPSSRYHSLRAAIRALKEGNLASQLSTPISNHSHRAHRSTWWTLPPKSKLRWPRVWTLLILLCQSWILRRWCH